MQDVSSMLASSSSDGRQYVQEHTRENMRCLLSRVRTLGANSRSGPGTHRIGAYYYIRSSPTGTFTLPSLTDEHKATG
jgi:hypothetical protein